MTGHTERAARRLVVVSAGLSQPSSSRLLANRLGAATEDALRHGGLEPSTSTIEVRDYAGDLVNSALTSFPSERLREAIDAVLAADGLIAVTPIFTASYSGLFKLFFDVLERDSLAGMPVSIGATGGTARHSLALDHALRPLFAYLAATVMPTGVFAAPEDWGTGDPTAGPDLVDRIQRAGRELAASMASRPRREPRDAFSLPADFEDVLRSTDEASPKRPRR